jgi:hypothetical protein
MSSVGCTTTAVLPLCVAMTAARWPRAGEIDGRITSSRWRAILLYPKSSEQEASDASKLQAGPQRKPTTWMSGSKPSFFSLGEWGGCVAVVACMFDVHSRHIAYQYIVVVSMSWGAARDPRPELVTTWPNICC